jgi:hypothetical protein
MKADTVELLCTKAHFTTEQALAVAEAIDMGIRDSELVTVPTLDARFLVFEHRFTAFETKINERFAAFEARMEQKFDRLRLQMIITILAAHAALGPMGEAVWDAIRRAL